MWACAWYKILLVQYIYLQCLEFCIILEIYGTIKYLPKTSDFQSCLHSMRQWYSVLTEVVNYKSNVLMISTSVSFILEFYLYAFQSWFSLLISCTLCLWFRILYFRVPTVFQCCLKVFDVKGQESYSINCFASCFCSTFLAILTLFLF